MLQIHDELCFSVNSDKDVDPIKKKMESAIENLKVPFTVDVALGKSWGEAKE
jgi:DNA polymerase I-like protein with 3'-5' exonuclease and polymerase domains